jgi:hypothetical protein
MPRVKEVAQLTMGGSVPMRLLTQLVPILVAPEMAVTFTTIMLETSIVSSANAKQQDFKAFQIASASWVHAPQ